MLIHLLTFITTLILGLFHPTFIHTQVLASTQYISPTTQIATSSAPTPSTHSTHSTSSGSPTYSAHPTYSVQTIDCTGPDNKHFFATEQQCVNLNAAWKTSPSPNPNNVQKISNHTYTMQYTPDAYMASPQEIFLALNVY